MLKIREIKSLDESKMISLMIEKTFKEFEMDS